MRRIVGVVVVGLAAAGCANWDEHQRQQRAKFEGKPVEMMYREYGTPVGERRVPDGRRYMDFVGYRGAFRCEAQAVVGPDDRVLEVTSVSGQNGCITPF